jgi:hypothetical protein
VKGGKAKVKIFSASTGEEGGEGSGRRRRDVCLSKVRRRQRQRELAVGKLSYEYFLHTAYPAI